jgi:hypothetical protein
MGLEDYRVHDRVEVRVAGAWHAGEVREESNALGFVTVNVDESSFDALVSDPAGIRPLDEQAEQIEIGAKLLVNGPHGGNWHGEAVALAGGKVTVRLEGLDGQTVIVAKDSCTLA